jgi:hypothetical protein
MFRRHFLTSTIAGLLGLVGCRRKTAPPAVIAYTTSAPPTMESLTDLVKEKIQAELPESRASEFALLTILGIAGFLLQVIQYCKANQVAKQHAAVNSKPRGGVAAKMRARLAAEYCNRNPDASIDTAKTYVDGAIQAFAKADPDEMKQLHADLQSLQDSPTPVDLFNFSQSLGAAT